MSDLGLNKGNASPFRPYIGLESVAGFCPGGVPLLNTGSGPSLTVLIGA
jgi:hypothetical protein